MITGVLIRAARGVGYPCAWRWLCSTLGCSAWCPRPSCLVSRRTLGLGHPEGALIPGAHGTGGTAGAMETPACPTLGSGEEGEWQLQVSPPFPGLFLGLSE